VNNSMIDTIQDDLLAQVKIRQAVREDLPALEWDGELLHYRRLFADVFQYTQQGEAIIWLADLPGSGIIGQLFVHLHSQRADLADGVHRAYIYGFRVRSAYQGRGLGTHMMARAEEDLYQRGFTWVALNVGRDNPGARRLYERLGYSVVGPDPGRWSYIDNTGVLRHMHEPAWRMEKKLFFL
jgi:ribosomal protein S18 acetylase RimI-like enzyme